MKKLLAGVRRFQKDVYAQPVDRDTPRPHTLFIGCADAGLAPSILTQTDPGELLVITNAGNMMPDYYEARMGFSGEAATLQYAVEILRVTDIVVCGHAGCGAVTALLDATAEMGKFSLLADWIDQEGDLRDLVGETCGTMSKEARLSAAVAANVVYQLADLRTFPFVKNREDAGRLQLHGWLYDARTGAVKGYDAEKLTFVPIDQLYRATDVVAGRDGQLEHSAGH